MSWGASEAMHSRYATGVIGPKEKRMRNDDPQPTRNNSPGAQAPSEKRRFDEPVLIRRGTLAVRAGEGDYQIFSPGFDDK